MAQGKKMATKAVSLKLPIASVRSFNGENLPVSHVGELVSVNTNGFVHLKLGVQDFYVAIGRVIHIATPVARTQLTEEQEHEDQ